MSERLIGGRYRIVREIASGGMGTVYEARHSLTQNAIALKVLHPHVARDEASRQRFLREVSAPAQIGHPGICEVYDAGFDDQDGSVFFAMELLQGETLRGPLDRNDLDPGQLFEVFDQLLDALGAAHDKGIVHRDLKPENVFLVAQPGGGRRVKIVDFGIVTDTADAEKNVTQAGTAMGTPEYMSPEQATNARDVSAASDVWACGVMLYEALARKAPFSGGTPTAVVVEVITQPHPPLEAFAPGAPKALLALVDRCLEKKPENRPENARALRQQLAAIRRDAPTRAAAPAALGEAVTTGPMMVPSGGGGETRPGGIAPTAISTGPFPPGAGAVGAAGAAPANAPGVTPPSFAANPPGPEKSRGGGSLKWLLLVGGGLLALVGLVLFAGAAAVFSGVFADDTGQVRIQSNLRSGEIFVDGTSKGPLTAGRILELPVGPRHLEARIGGAVVAQAAVEVQGGALVDVDLMSAEQRLTGLLGPGDELTPDGRFSDRFEFEWPSGETVHLEATSSTVDTFLWVRFPDGAVLENDDANGTDAGLDFVTTAAGTYEILVTTYSRGDSGPYELYVRAQ